jgi:hypothetical protein
MKRNYFTIVGVLLMATLAFAKEDPNLAKPTQGLNNSVNKSLKTVEELCQPSKSQADLNINNVRATILGGGDMWWDLNVARYEVPKGSNRHSMFAGALWLGGVDEGNQLKLAAMTYRQRGNDYWPGPLSTDGTASTNKDICDKYDRHWIITREEVETHKAWLDCLDDPNCIESEVFPGYESQIPRVILEWPGNGVDGDLPYMLAPFIDRDQDGVYDPLIDYPAYDIRNEFDCRLKETDVLYGDQTIWWVYNDRGNVHSESQGSALGFEIRAQAFAFSTNDEVNNMTFYNYRILNKSTFRLADTYFSTWFDPDLGNAIDDIIGCDIPRGLGYVYNADATDEGPLGYGSNPPAVGFDFFQGPFADYFDGLDNDRDGCVDGVRDPETGLCVAEDPSTGVNERIIMSQFMYFNNTQNAVSGNPSNASEFYNYMRARWRNGFPLVIESPSGPGNTGNGDGFVPDGSGTPTRYAYPGDTYDTTGAFEPSSPLPNGGWYESPANLADKRGLHSAGPFSLAPGALNFITTGIVWERDQNNSDLFASVEKIIIADDKSQRLFDNCFQVLNGPDAPDITIQELNQELILQLSYRPSSNNYKFRYREKDPLITSEPGDVDSLLQLNPNYFEYVFEGFQIFQLANKDVSISDIYDPTQARLVAQTDIQNGSTQLINWNVDPNLNQLVPQDMTLTSNNKGIFMSFKFTEDAFATGVRALINHREYYYTVLAYGVNQYEVFQPTTSPNGQRLPYLAGRRNINTYTAIPHIVNSEQFGTNQQGQYGDGPEITRIEGVGNGALELELSEESVTTIVNDFQIQYPSYTSGKGPVDIKVVDPLAVPSGDYILEFTSSDAKATWNITTLSGDVIAASDTNLEFFNEQIIPELGLSVTIVQPPAPGGDDEGEYNNGVITSNIVYEDNSKAWWAGISDDNSYTPYNWILAGSNTNATAPPADQYPDFDGDEKSFFSTIIDGTWGPGTYLSGIIRATPPAATPYGLGPWPSEVGTRPAALDLRSVDVVITDDPTQWTRVPVFELSEDPGLAEGGKKKLVLRNDTSYSLVNGQLVHDLGLDPGWSYFPGYAISVETGQRLNMAFGENSWLKSENGDDMLWNPTDVATIVPGDNINGGYVFGGQHYIYVFAADRRAGLSFIDNSYKGDNPTDNPMYNDLLTLETNGAGRTRVWGTCMWASIPLLRSGYSFDPYTELPTTTRFRIRVTTQYGKRVVDNTNDGNPKFQFSTGNIAVELNDKAVAENALDIVRVVPNPYYGYSKYETSQLDNTVKITNLPPKCMISIYSTNGTLIRQISKDNSDTWVPWDLKNQYNVPIASGVYIIHIDAGDIGETVIKWFGALRPVDLNAF